MSPGTRASILPPSKTNRERRVGPALGLVLLLTVSACHAKPQVRLGPDTNAPTPSVARLHRDIDTILSTPALARSYWGILIRSLRTDDTLYASSPGKLF